MAVNAAIQWNIRQGGSDTNGGGFRAGASGTDWSLQDAAQYNLANGQTQGSAVILLPAAVSDMVGNVAWVQGGTGAVVANWYEIISINAGVSITVDRTTGLTSGTGVNVHIGGAFATPGVISSLVAPVTIVSGNKIKWKYNATPYAITTATPGPGGPVVLAAVHLYIQGYDVTPGDNTGNKPTYQWTTAPGSITFAISLSASIRQLIENCAVDCNGQANASGISMGGQRDSALNCLVSNATQTGTSGYGTGGSSTSCRSNNCLSGFNAVAVCNDCEAIGTTGQTGFLNVSQSITRCLARGMATGYSSASIPIKESTADGCTTAGFTTIIQAGFVDCLATNSGIGFSVGSNFSTLTNCACYNNTTNVTGTPLANTGLFASGNTITGLAADPYVDRAGADYRRNSNSPGGGQLRGMGIGVYGQTDNVDIGAVQHSDSAVSGPVYYSY